MLPPASCTQALEASTPGGPGTLPFRVSHASPIHRSQQMPKVRKVGACRHHNPRALQRRHVLRCGVGRGRGRWAVEPCVCWAHAALNNSLPQGRTLYLPPSAMYLCLTRPNPNQHELLPRAHAHAPRALQQHPFRFRELPSLNSTTLPQHGGPSIIQGSLHSLGRPPSNSTASDKTSLPPPARPSLAQGALPQARCPPSSRVSSLKQGPPHLGDSPLQLQRRHKLQVAESAQPCRALPQVQVVPVGVGQAPDRRALAGRPPLQQRGARATPAGGQRPGAKGRHCCALHGPCATNAGPDTAACQPEGPSALTPTPIPTCTQRSTVQHGRIAGPGWTGAPCAGPRLPLARIQHAHPCPPPHPHPDRTQPP